MNAAHPNVSFRTLPPRPHTWLKLILHHLGEHNLWGIPQFIDEDGEKRPLVKWRGLRYQPPSAAEVDLWCRRFPDAGAAIPTGPGTRLLVVDADSADAIEWLELRGVPETVIVRTKRGLHYYFQYPIGVRVGNSAGAIAPGVDIRGDGGMATAVGTRRPDGFVYHYDEGHALGDVAIADPPKWLLDWLVEEAQRKELRSEAPIVPHPFSGRTSAWARTAIDRELERLANAANGCRNSTLATVTFKLGQLAAGGEADGAELRLALEAIASQWPDERCKSLNTIARSFVEGMAHPRQRLPLKFKRRNRSAHTPGLAGEYQEAEDEVANG
jgi:hypothetical protein